MNSKDEEISKYNKFIKKILKSIAYTFFIFILSTQVIYSLIASLVFKNMSVEQSNTWGILSFCIGIIFTIFYCTFTLIEEIKNKKL